MKANQRGKLLLLQRFLEENTDAEHPATMEQILSWLEANAEVSNRKTVYEDLAWLRDQGLDIQSVRMGRGMGYYIGSRAFALSELKLLVDAVQSSKFITESKSMSLIGRIEKWTCQEKCSRETPKVWNWMKFETERSVAEWSFKFRRLLMRPAPAAFCERPPAASRPDCSCRLEAGCSK